MPFVYVDSLDDPRLDAYARLTEAQLRNKLEPEKGIFIAESIKVIDRALDAGVQPVSVLMTPESSWGYDLLTSAYDEAPAASWDRIFAHVKARFPAPDDAICRLIGKRPKEG